MTVKELKELLDTIPDDAIVCREGDEYKDDYRYVAQVNYRRDADAAQPRNSILFR